MDIDDLIDILTFQAEVVDPLPGFESDLRDIKDQSILDTLLSAQRTSGADYLITGDRDLLALAGRYPILDPAQFWARHGGL